MPILGDDWRFCPRCGAALERRVRGGMDRPSCPACGFVFFANMGVGAAVVIQDAAGRVLLVQRGPGHFGAGLWCLPCGYVEWDEDVREAAAREALEEAGVEVEIGDVVHVADESPRARATYRRHLVRGAACVDPTAPSRRRRRRRRRRVVRPGQRPRRWRSRPTRRS